MYRSPFPVLAALWLLLGTATAFAEPLRQLSIDAPVVHRPGRMVRNESTARLFLLDARNAVLTILTEEPASDGWQRTHWQLPGQPLDLALLPSGQLAICDRDLAVLRVVDCSQAVPELLSELPLPREPYRLSLTADGRWLVIAHCWTHALSILSTFELTASGHQAEVRTLPLPFLPGELLAHPQQPLVMVADAFQGHVLLLDAVSRRVLGDSDLGVHNIRGLTWQGESLLLTCQQLHAEPTTAENIAAGLVIENLLAEIRVAPGQSSPLHYQHRTELGVPSHGAADPTGVAVGADRVFVAAAGVQQLLALSSSLQVQSRIDVGHHPTQLFADGDGRRLFLLESFEPALRVVDAASLETMSIISLELGGTTGPRERGEALFFNGERSQFGWMSCHSCHGDGHTNGRLADTFGDGDSGAPKSVLSLLGGRDANPWAWNGSMQTLHGQVLKSLESTVHSPIISARDAMDLVAYLHTLDPPPPLVDDAQHELIEQGRRIFTRRGCQRCHIPPLTYTSDLTYEVGTEDEHGQKKFNPPSLRGVGQRFGYLHDLRAPNLEAVFEVEGHQLDESLSPEDLKALTTFLRSL